jgi:hypothetical protein
MGPLDYLTVSAPLYSSAGSGGGEFSMEALTIDGNANDPRIGRTGRA